GTGSGLLVHGLAEEKDVGGPIGLAYSGDNLEHTVAERLWDDLNASPNEGFSGLPPPPPLLEDQLPSAEEERYQGPSADAGFQSVDDIIGAVGGFVAPSIPAAVAADDFQDATRRIGSDATVPVAQMPANELPPLGGDNDATIAVGVGNREQRKPVLEEKVVIGQSRSVRSGNAHIGVDASLAQAESLKVAQQRIIELEAENDRLRQSHDEISTAAEVITSRLNEMTSRIEQLEKEKRDIEEAYRAEIMILKGNIQFKEQELAKARNKVEELETRIKNDFRKVRVREKELENRLDLLRSEKGTLLRAKDEQILDLKRKIDQHQTEIENYRLKLQELNRSIESYQEHFKKTVRALRLALSNLEAAERGAVQFKKAE
ncbi:MAG: hypothetical protein N2578_06585, partial [Bdellovibrionaceae bacterium]|nr:hypothetical protein [Pseudobdellovibrionaceae bacterium]